MQLWLHVGWQWYQVFPTPLMIGLMTCVNCSELVRLTDSGQDPSPNVWKLIVVGQTMDTFQMGGLKAAGPILMLL